MFPKYKRNKDVPTIEDTPWCSQNLHRCSKLSCLVTFNLSNLCRRAKMFKVLFFNLFNLCRSRAATLPRSTRWRRTTSWRVSSAPDRWSTPAGGKGDLITILQKTSHSVWRDTWIAGYIDQVTNTLNHGDEDDLELRPENSSWTLTESVWQILNLWKYDFFQQQNLTGEKIVLF